MAEKNTAETRFSMVKGRHSRTLEKAKCEKEIDREMVPLCDFIAGTKNFFTSSGCSGRILLLGLIDRTKKNSYFHRKWHGKAKPAEVLKALVEETRGELWLKMEPFIVHIGTNSLESARTLLSLKDRAGVKRGGIIVAKPGKFIVELIGTEELSVMLKKGGKLLAGEEFVKETVKEANRKIVRNYQRLKRFEKEARGALK